MYWPNASLPFSSFLSILTPLWNAVSAEFSLWPVSSDSLLEFKQECFSLLFVEGDVTFPFHGDLPLNAPMETY
mgnify:CR=1 FL=1